MNKSSATGDNIELARFNRLAHTWWDSDGPMWPLHLLNGFRIDAVVEVLRAEGVCREGDQPLAGLKVLDIGCGGGILSESLCNLGAQVTAIDLAEQSIKIASQHALQGQLQIDYRVAEIAQVNEQFDIVFNLEVVEHVQNPTLFMELCAQRVKPGGYLFVATINKTIMSFIVAIVGAEYILRLLPKGTHQWNKFVDPKHLQQILLKHQLPTFWQTGVGLNPFTRRFYVQKSLAVNYMLAAKKQDG